MKIDITTTNRLVTLRRRARSPIFYMNPCLNRWQRFQEKHGLKPNHRTHHADAGGLRGSEPYRIKQTHEVNWLGFDFLYTRRYPLTAEQRAAWTSPSFLAESTALKHY